MRTADTNLLVRITIRDDEGQAVEAENLLMSPDSVALSVVTLCEFAWLLRSRYKVRSPRIAAAIRGYMTLPNVIADVEAVQAGLAFLDAGGDFADGVIAYEGRRLGALTFVSFDRKAVAILQSQGHSAQLIA